MRRSLVILALVSLAACSKQPPLAPPGATSNGAKSAQPKWAADVALEPAATVATINGVPITAAQLDEKVEKELKRASQEYVTKVHELRQEALESMILEQVLETEATSKGTTVEELVQQEVAQKAPPATEEELQSAYDRFVRGRYDVSFEDAKAQLAQELGREKTAVRAKAYFEELKTKYQVKTSLPEPKVARVEVAATGPSKGPADAKVTIVEFSDFECPFCSRVNPAIAQVMKEYEGKVRVVFRHFPLPMHPNAPKAAEASLCADDQGKFWEMHDALFANQQALSVPDLKDYAKTIGLDQAKFDACLDSGSKAEQVAKDMSEGEAAGVTGTPAFFVNGRMLAGALPFEEFKKVIDAELAAN